jgi:hypothetical protein
MGRRFLFLALLLASVSFAMSAPASAYTPTISPDGKQVRWGQARKLNLAGNPSNRSGVTDANFRVGVVRGLQRWKAASNGVIGFDYWQGTDREVYEPSSEYDGLSSIYFASNAKSGAPLSPNVLGLTQVWYNTETGEVLETDIVLNDRDFRFTNDSRDTSGYGSGSGGGVWGVRTSVFIENVITHELGHAFGLSHTGGLQSTMLFMESPEQAHLGCDEAAAIRAIYPDGSSKRGTITGKVTSESGDAVFGAHVLAISRQRGVVIATGLTGRDGRYAIDSLEPGKYFLMVEPFLAGSSALPSFYSGINSNLCPGSESFERAVLADFTGHRPVAVSVASGASTTAPEVSVRCKSSTAIASALGTASFSLASAPVIYDGLSDGNGFGIMDRFGYFNTMYYRLNLAGGALEIHALSYSLYSPVKVSLALLDASGSVVQARADGPVYVSESGFVNYDAAIRADVPPGDYFLRVAADGLNPTMYPAGPMLLDAVPFMLLTGSVNEGLPALAGELPVHARCRMNDNFAGYVSPPGNPQRASKDEGSAVGFCGTIGTVGDGRPGGSGPGSGAIAGWLLPWVMMALMARVAKRHPLRLRRQAATL